MFIELRFEALQLMERSAFLQVKRLRATYVQKSGNTWPIYIGIKNTGGDALPGGRKC